MKIILTALATILSSCFISLLAYSKPIYHIQNNTFNEVNFYIYSTHEGRMSAQYLKLISEQKNQYIIELLLNTFEFANQNIKYKFTASSMVTLKSKTGVENKYLSCTGFIKELFNSLGAGFEIPYASSYVMVNSKHNKTINDHFDVITTRTEEEVNGVARSGFRPKTGDILAYNYLNPKTKKRKGHAVVVIDPEQCIAVNSTSWILVDQNGKVHGTDDLISEDSDVITISESEEDEVEEAEEMEEGSGVYVRDRTKSGVYFQKIIKGICQNGFWSSWDNSTNKFQVLLRHKKFLE